MPLGVALSACGAGRNGFGLASAQIYKRVISGKVEAVASSHKTPVTGESHPLGTSPLTLPLLCCSGRLGARRQDSWRAQMCTWMCTRWLSCGVTTCLLLMTLRNTPTSLGSTGSTVSGRVLYVGQTLPKESLIRLLLLAWCTQEDRDLVVQTCPLCCYIPSLPLYLFLRYLPFWWCVPRKAQASDKAVRSGLLKQ